MENQNPVEKEPSIPSIDDSLSRLTGRLFSLLNNLKDATRGEQPEVSDGKDEVETIPSSSLDSINRRINDAHDTIEIMERFMTRFHS